MVVSRREFARLGGGEVAYIKSMTTDEAMKLYPAIKGLPRGICVFALHAADGTQLIVVEARELAEATIRLHELEPVSVH